MGINPIIRSEKADSNRMNGPKVDTKLPALVVTSEVILGCMRETP